MNNVFSKDRKIIAPDISLPKELKLNERLKMEGEHFLSLLPSKTFPVVFFDPQYRGILDKMKYGNEGKKRGKERSSLTQMSEDTIIRFINAIDRILIPSGHLFLWIDKFHLCQGIKSWINGTKLDIVDLLVWNKERMGMGYRTRRVSEYLMIIQKLPRKAKEVWKLHDIKDIISEKIQDKTHAHNKPIILQSRLIEAVSNEGDVIIDPASGSFSVMKSSNSVYRNFLGCDIRG